MKVILLRHAQSVKNLKKIHGGQGEELTDLGVNQAKEVAKLLQANHLNDLMIFASTSFHTRLTAQIIAEEMGLEVGKPISFRPLYLGIADGLSEQQLEELSPETAEKFRKWRRKEIDIKSLKVDKMEPYMEFWNRAQELLRELPQQSNVLLVCSNSLMIVLAHCMAANHPELTDKYRHIDIANCGMITFDRLGDSYILDAQLTNVVF